ncbi:hypothetical protein BH10BAC2_BH10BAC2_05700 [soil metagenome]
MIVKTKAISAKIVLLFFFSFFSVKRISQTITTIAGTGNSELNGENVLALNANLNFPTGIAVDTNGNVYFAEPLINRIRKIDNSTGLITTIAGTGSAGYSDDNGNATDAEINQPYPLCLDKKGNLFFSDHINSVIRKINLSTNIISTVAGKGGYGYEGDGGDALSALLNLPLGIQIDDNNNLYIADWYNNRIRKVDLETNIITTIAGTGNLGYSGDGGLALNAELIGAEGIAVDTERNIYIINATSVVRKINKSTGVINTVARTNEQGNTGDNGPAIQATFSVLFDIETDANNNYYIVDNYSHVVRKVDVKTNVITTIAGTGFGEGTATGGFGGDGGPATAALLSGPYNITFGKDGTMYIVDNKNHRIRKVESVVLPLQLLSFSATRNGKANLLKWSTAQEINTNRFEIQRSNNSIDFTSVGSIRSFNNGKAKNDYTFTDAQPLKQINYYRLKMIDKDGGFTYSTIKNINNTASFDVTLYPNPVHQNLTLSFNTEQAIDVQVEIVNAGGKKVYTKKMQLTYGASFQSINVAALKAGSYFVKCITGDGQMGLKFVKQ